MHFLREEAHFSGRQVFYMGKGLFSFRVLEETPKYPIQKELTKLSTEGMVNGNRELFV